MIDITSEQGKRLELFIEEEGGVTYVEVRDWQTGEVKQTLVFQGTKAEFAVKVAEE